MFRSAQFKNCFNVCAVTETIGSINLYEFICTLIHNIKFNAIAFYKAITFNTAISFNLRPISATEYLQCHFNCQEKYR